MAQININEISQNYTYNIGANSYAEVAFPITACWGPAYEKVDGVQVTDADMLEKTVFARFPATQAGLEAFVSTYRGPAANYRLAKDYSYQIAMTLLTSGYDVLVCRLCPGTKAATLFTQGTDDAISIGITAKYPGTFGNNLKAKLTKSATGGYWNLITYVMDDTGVQTALENIIFVLDEASSTDTLPFIGEVQSNFFDFCVTGALSNSGNLVHYVEANPQPTGTLTADTYFTRSASAPYTYTAATGTAVSSTTYYTTSQEAVLIGGTDKEADGTAAAMKTDASAIARQRYLDCGNTSVVAYETALAGITVTDVTFWSTVRYNEWLYTSAYKVYDILKDKLSYSPQRVISPGWDDQNISLYTGNATTLPDFVISPLHRKLMDVSYFARCATAFIDVPKCLPRSGVWNESTATPGYAQLLGRFVPTNTHNDINTGLYSTHYALYAPWGQYQYVGTNKQNVASPSFQALLIMRSMILNQSVQYEWALPTNRKNSVRLGALDYKVPKKYLDQWQAGEGVGVNVITSLPDLGTGIWGNSTCYELPPATYQALANLSTRLVMNAVENLAYKCGLAITFQYNNSEAYSSFYAGVTPLLDTMKSVGAVEDYYVRMSSDIDATGQVMSNTVVGKIYLVLAGVVNDINIDLIALPSGTDLGQYQS